MSTKSTIALLPCCHIYNDCRNPLDDTLCIDLAYGEIDGADSIEVSGNSEFANLMRYLLNGKSCETLEFASKGHKKMTTQQLLELACEQTGSNCDSSKAMLQRLIDAGWRPCNDVSLVENLESEENKKARD